MAFHVEAKRLSTVDLTVFGWHFHNQELWRSSPGESRQKAINLDKRRLEHNFFPAIAAPPGWRHAAPPKAWPAGKPHFSLDRIIYGPGTLPPDAGKITLSLEQKNWRLGSALIHNPKAEPTRYNPLRPNDWILIGLEGKARPSRCVLVMLDADAREDAPFTKRLAARFKGPRASGMLSPSALEALIDDVQPDPDHGIYSLRPGNEEAIDLGGAPPARTGTSVLDRAVYRGARTPRDVTAGRIRNEHTGKLGETIVDGYLAKQQSIGVVSGYEWTSSVIADSPYDFVVDPEGYPVHIDVKTTTGTFQNEFHVSINELKMIESGQPYQLYRVYEVDEASMTGKLRVCKDLAQLAAKLVQHLRGLPPGFDVMSVRVDPAALEWGMPIEISAARAA